MRDDVDNMPDGLLAQRLREIAINMVYRRTELHEPWAVHALMRAADRLDAFCEMRLETLREIARRNG